MRPLLVLLGTFVLSLFAIRLLSGDWDIPFAGNIGMSGMLLFTALGHFVYTKGMEMMVPSFIPFKKALVYLTGIIEIVAAIGLLVGSFHLITAMLLILFFILVVPCNIYAAIKKVDYRRGQYTGPGTSYLWLRVPLQFIFIAWVYVFNIDAFSIT